MIIFDLETLADSEHRRHFVDPSKRTDCYYHELSDLNQMAGWYYSDRFRMSDPPKPMKFIPDWDEFLHACGEDIPINPVIEIFRQLNDDEYNDTEIQIWSGRCESVREKTEKWLHKHTSFSRMNCRVLKMRPIGDNTPEHELKEKWLEETYEDTKWGAKTPIEFVFDSDPKSIEMWRRRGIFVFDCNQG